MLFEPEQSSAASLIFFKTYLCGIYLLCKLPPCTRVAISSLLALLRLSTHLSLPSIMDRAAEKYTIYNKNIEMYLEMNMLKWYKRQIFFKKWSNQNSRARDILTLGLHYVSNSEYNGSFISHHANR